MLQVVHNLLEAIRAVLFFDISLLIVLHENKSTHGYGESHISGPLDVPDVAN